MNVSVSTDALHSPVCVFYVDSSLPWPAESAVSGPSDPPCILCNSSTLSVASTDIPPPHFTKGYQSWMLSVVPIWTPPPPIIFFFFFQIQFLWVHHTSLLTKWVKEEKKKSVLSVFRSGRTGMSVYPDTFFISLHRCWMEAGNNHFLKQLSWWHKGVQPSISHVYSSGFLILTYSCRVEQNRTLDLGRWRVLLHSLHSVSSSLTLYIYTHYTQYVNIVWLHSDGLFVLLLLVR